MALRVGYLFRQRMPAALEVSELIEDMRQRLKPLKSRLFPQQVLLELGDTALLGQSLLNGKPGPVCIDVPLPSLTCKRGQPIEIEPLADLIGDLLVRDGLIDAFVMAALPPVAVQWRVIDWGGEEPPEDGLAELRRRNPDLGLAYPLAEAALDLQPLAGAPGKALLAATPQAVVEGWIKVFHQAGTNLDRLASPQTCRLAALQGHLAEVPAGSLVLLVTARAEERQLEAIRDGVPLFEWPMPLESGAMAAEAKRCLAFLQREFQGLGPVKLLVQSEGEGEGDTIESLEAVLGLPAQRLHCAPFASLVLQGLAIPELTP